MGDRRARHDGLLHRHYCRRGDRLRAGTLDNVVCLELVRSISEGRQEGRR